MIFDYDPKERIGDHICYYCDLSKIRGDYPSWEITKSLTNIFEDIHDGLKDIVT